MPIDLNIVSAGYDSTGNMDAVRNLLTNPISAISVPMMVQEMLVRCERQPHSIRYVRIWGHGAPGYMVLGTGNTYPRDEVNKLGLDETSMTLFNRAALGQLRGYFATDGNVALQGCSVAAGAIGQVLLETLAMLWQVSVAASEQEQIIEHSGDMPLIPLHGRIRHVVFNMPGGRPFSGVNRGFGANDPRRRYSVSYSSVLKSDR